MQNKNLLTLSVFHFTELEEKRVLNIKKGSPFSGHQKDSKQRNETSEGWNNYHKSLDRRFGRIPLERMPRFPLEIRSDLETFLKWVPYSRSSQLHSIEPEMRRAEASLQRITKEKTGFYTEHNRRHKKGYPCSQHMVFFRTIEKGSKDPIWKLYSETDNAVLLSFKPILQKISEILLEMWSPDFILPCPTSHTLFGTVFTTMVVNMESCEWHLDPQDKFAVLIYFGDFSGGSLLLGPPFHREIPVEGFDWVYLLSTKVWHKASPFLGKRFNVSFYAKHTSIQTVKGRLRIDPAALWAVKK